MQIHKHVDSPVFDNLYAKPTPIGLHQQFSMAVVISVNGEFFRAQFHYESCMWHVLPSKRYKDIPDRAVEYWFYPPGTDKLLQKYKQDVEEGKCHDPVTRKEEYIPNPNSFPKDMYEVLLDRDYLKEQLEKVPNSVDFILDLDKDSK